MNWKFATLFIVFEWIFFTPEIEAQSIEKWFPKAELTKIGVHYYPEQFPENEWEKDFQAMGKFGFQYVHFGGFAWGKLEPDEGKFEFAWLDKAVEMAAKNGLKVVLCTPSAAPPIWVTEKYPEVCVQSADGEIQRHGSKQHASWSSLKYRELTGKIATNLATRYGQDKRIWGWQIDNEPSHHSAENDYSNSAQNRFREWLKNSYRSIEKLNSAWGTAVWSAGYTQFEQVRIPNPAELPQVASPAALLDFKKFSAWECADFINMQAKTLRDQISKDQWVTTTLMSSHLAIDPGLLTDIDFVSFSAYPASGFALGHGSEGFRVNDASFLSQPLDYYKSTKGITGLSELQTGQTYWGRTNPVPFPGAVRLWLFQSVGSGAAIAGAVPFKQPATGPTQYQQGVINQEDMQLSQGGKEFAQTIKELAELRKSYAPSREMPARLKALRTAILYQRENTWDMANQRLGQGWNANLHLTKYYEALKAMQAPVDFVDEESDFSMYPFLVVPGYEMVSESLVNKLIKYAEKGGQLILTCRFGQKDKSGALQSNRLLLKNLAGVKVRFFDMLPEERNAKASYAGKNYEWNNWGEVLDAEPGTIILATYPDQFYKNSAAITQKKSGKGTVTYIGLETDMFRLEKELLKQIYQKSSGNPIAELPTGLEVVYRDGLWFGLNFHTSESRTVEIPATAKILLGQKELKPCEVVIWAEK